MTVRDDRITLLDIFKGLLFVAFIIAVVKLYPVFIFLFFTLCFWLGDTTLFFLPETFRAKLLLGFIGFSFLAIFPIFLAFGKATGETFGAAQGYKALTELKNIFGGNSKSSVGNNEPGSFFHYFTSAFIVILFTLFIIGLVLKIKDLNSESFQAAINNFNHFIKEIIQMLKEA